MVEPGLECPMPTEHLADRGAGPLIDPARIEEREEHGDMGRNSGTGRGVEPVTPCTHRRLRLWDPHDQPRLPCLEHMPVVVLHRNCLSAGHNRERPDYHRHSKQDRHHPSTQVGPNHSDRSCPRDRQVGPNPAVERGRPTLSKPGPREQVAVLDFGAVAAGQRDAVEFVDQDEAGAGVGADADGGLDGVGDVGTAPDGRPRNRANSASAMCAVAMGGTVMWTTGMRSRCAGGGPGRRVRGPVRAG